MKNLQPLKKLLFPSFYNKDKSEVTAKVIGKGNYTGTNDKKVSTNMASLSDALVTVPKTRNYSAKAGDFMKASVNVKESSAKGASALKKGKDYDVEYFINDSKTKATGDEVTKPGDVITVKVSAKDGSYYKDEKSATFTIVQNLNKADLKLKKDNATVITKELTYTDGKPNNIELDGNEFDLVLSEKNGGAEKGTTLTLGTDYTIKSYGKNILNNEITFHFVIECAEFGPLKAAYFLSEFVRIILYD